jgi:hypothetical protein
MKGTTMLRAATAVSTLALLVAAAAGQTTMPGEFETAASLLRPSFSYFGGVSGYSTAMSSTTVFTGNSMRMNVNFQPDAIFNVAGAGFISDIMTGAALTVPASADTFSITVDSPVHNRVYVFVRVREDDNADGAINAIDDDDQWESTPVLLTQGVQTINMPFSAFEDTDPDAGNNIQNFTNTTGMRYYIVFETRNTSPGGRQTSPVSFTVDHVGFFTGAQTPLPAGCAADFNADGFLNPDDLSDFITCFFLEVQFPGTCPQADFNADAFVNPDDLSDYITAFFLGC